MNILLIVLGVIAGIAVLILLVALFVPKNYVVNRSILIERPPQVVFDYVRILKNQVHYNKWVMADLSAKTTYKGTDGQPGFIYAWDSENKNVGKGEQEIQKVTEGKTIQLETRFERPFRGLAHVTMAITRTQNDFSTFTWTFSSAMPYPMNIVRLFFNMEKVLGKDMEASLTLLKNQLEK